MVCLRVFCGVLVKVLCSWRLWLLLRCSSGFCLLGRACWLCGLDLWFVLIVFGFSVPWWLLLFVNWCSWFVRLLGLFGWSHCGFPGYEPWVVCGCFSGCGRFAGLKAVWFEFVCLF